MATACYGVDKYVSRITNTKDTCQGTDAPRWTPAFCAGSCCRVVTYAEGADTVGGPSLTNEFRRTEDDLVTKY